MLQVRQIIKKEEEAGTSEEEIPEEIKTEPEGPLVTLEGEKDKKKKKKEVSAIAGTEEKKKKKKKKISVSEDSKAGDFIMKKAGLYKPSQLVFCQNRLMLTLESWCIPVVKEGVLFSRTQPNHLIKYKRFYIIQYILNSF